MSTPTPFVSLDALLAPWSQDVLHGEPPARWPAGSGALARFPLGPELVTLIGGAPGAGKSALANQLAFDAARLSSKLRVLITCCEMPTAVLLNRQLARLSGVPYARIRDRALTDVDRKAIGTGFATMDALRDRIAFHTGPFELSAIAEAADCSDTDLLLIDYLQRLAVPGSHRDKRSQTNAVLDTFRRFADAGRGVLMLSSVGRQPNKHGRSGYDDLTLASFKESGDIEYSADDAYILTPPENGTATLKHVKARHSEMSDIVLRADLSVMRFDSAGGGTASGEQVELLEKARQLHATRERKKPQKGTGA